MLPRACFLPSACISPTNIIDTTKTMLTWLQRPCIYKETKDMKKQNEVKKTVVVMENEQPTEGMPGAEQAKVARDAEREAMKAANDQAQVSPRHQPTSESD